MQRSIFAYVRAHSWRDQLAILALTLVSLPFFYYWVELPKRIVDDALGGGPGTRTLFGAELARLDFLLALCLIFLALVIVNGIFKYIINVYKGIVGERMLRRLRYDLYSRILRFPPGHFRVVSQGQLVQMINAEVEPLGGFIGDAYSLPAYQGGMLLTILAFMFLQNPLMGVAAIILYPLQILIIPRLQRQVNLLGKARVRQVRVLAERIGETATGVDDIRANAAGTFERARFSDELGRVFFIRMQIYRKKFFIKFLNNFLAQFAPFLFYSVGGFLVLQGELTIGAILAIVAAHEKLASPWKELLTYYQLMWDAEIKYEQVVAQFDPPQMRPVASDEAQPAPAIDLQGPLIARGLSLEDADGGGLDDVRFEIAQPARIAVLGPPDAGQSLLLKALAGLLPIRPGTLLVGDEDVARLPESVTGRAFAFVGNPAQVFAGSLRDNLLYGLKPRPLQPAAEGGGRGAVERTEARAAANSPHDSAADWVDLELAGVADRAELERRLLEVLAAVNLERDVYALGLRGRLRPERAAAEAERVVDTRRRFARLRSESRRLARLVEGFDPERYNLNATLAENLLFGTPLDSAYDIEHLAQNRVVRDVLRDLELEAALLRLGYDVAATMVELFAELSADHEYYRRFSFIGADDLPDYRALVARIAPEDVGALRDKDDADRLMALAMKLIPARHRLGLVDDELQARLVTARHRLRSSLPEADRDKIAFFDPDRFNHGASLQDNILFGRIALDQANAEATVMAHMAEMIDDMGLRALIIEVGLDAEAGVGGIRLSQPQRQRLAIARALVRRPQILILDNATAVFDRREQERLRDSVFEACAGRSLVWAHAHDEWADDFDQVVVLDAGRVAAVGTPTQVRSRTAGLSPAAGA